MLRQRVALVVVLAVSTTVVAEAKGSCEERAAAAIGSEIAVLRKLLEDAKGGLPEAQPQLDQGATLLDRAASALGSGSCYLALERLTAARPIIEPGAFLSTRAKTLAELTPEVAARAVATLERDFAAGRAQLARESSSSLPAAVRAIRAEAVVQAPVLAATMPMWHEIDDPVGAIYYGGSGIALAKAVAFIDTLTFRSAGAAPAIAPLGAALEEYERALIATYRPPLEKDRHREFISASAALKTARELLAAGRPEGTLYAYLRARRIGARLTNAALEAQTADTVRAAIERARPRLESATDHSMAALFLEQAESQLEMAATSPDALLVAAAVAEDVLPEYFRLASDAARGAGNIAAAAPETPSGVAAPSVTVTLVRWPYT